MSGEIHIRVRNEYRHWRYGRKQSMDSHCPIPETRAYERCKVQSTSKLTLKDLLRTFYSLKSQQNHGISKYLQFSKIYKRLFQKDLLIVSIIKTWLIKVNEQQEVSNWGGGEVTKWHKIIRGEFVCLNGLNLWMQQFFSPFYNWPKNGKLMYMRRKRRGLYPWKKCEYHVLTGRTHTAKYY